jgi:hypothetical protein
MGLVDQLGLAGCLASFFAHPRNGRAERYWAANGCAVGAASRAGARPFPHKNSLSPQARKEQQFANQRIASTMISTWVGRFHKIGALNPQSSGRLRAPQLAIVVDVQTAACELRGIRPNRGEATTSFRRWLYTFR